MKKVLFIFSFIVFAVSFSNAQTYESALGLRVGYPLSISYKKNTTERKALEFFGGIRPFNDYNEMRLNAALQIHSPIGDGDNFRWYYGGGAGVAVYSFDSTPANGGGASVTASFYLGLELTFDELPLNFTLDWVPTLYIGGYGSGFGGGYGALAIRYVLLK